MPTNTADPIAAWPRVVERHEKDDSVRPAPRQAPEWPGDRQAPKLMGEAGSGTSCSPLLVQKRERPYAPSLPAPLAGWGLRGAFAFSSRSFSRWAPDFASSLSFLDTLSRRSGATASSPSSR